MSTELIVKDIQDKLHTAFKKLKFDAESHTYTLETRVLPSVSSKLKSFYSEFDTLQESEMYAERRGFLNRDVYDAWEGEKTIASDKGHRVHDFGEHWCIWTFFNHGKKPRPSCKQCLGIIDFWNNMPSYIVPVAFELRMYNEMYGYAGTCDVLCLDTRDNTLIIFDYKTNKKLKDEEYPSDHVYHISPRYNIRQDNFGKYSLQLSFYQILLEAVGFKVKGRVIVWLEEDKPNKKLYQTFKTKDLSQELLTLFKQKKI